MPAVWEWLLADASGAALAELTTAAGKRIAYRRNAYAEAQFTISHEDEAASLLLGALSTGIPTLRCYRNGTLRFAGHLAPFQEDAGEQSLISAVFRSPFYRMLGDGQGSGRFTPASSVFTGMDAGAIAQSLLTTANTDGSTGLIPGTTELTRTRDRTYQYANVGQAITDLTNVLDGFDFTETFLNAGATLATLDIIASQGADSPLSRFEFGAGTLANVADAHRVTSPPLNRVTITGGNGLSGVKSHAWSIANYGLWPTVISASDVIEQSTLDDKAQELLRPLPVKTVSFTPDALLAPKPWDDYSLGSTVPLYVDHFAFQENVSVRVNAFTVVIDDNGNEATEIADPTTPEEEATIRANLQVEVV